MANWALFCRDVIHGRFDPTDQVSCSKNAAYAGNVVDGDPSSVWYPEDTAASTFVFGMPSGGLGTTIKAVALCNHNMAGETLTLYSAGTFTTTPGISRGSWTITDNEDTVFILETASWSSFYWQVGFSGASTDNYVGEISLLDNDYYFPLDYPAAPRYPLGLSAGIGAAVQRASSGVPREQILGGVPQQFGLEVSPIDMSVDTPGIGRKIYNWHREGGSHRLWVTDDTFGSTTSTIGRGLYCFLPSLPAPITHPGARGSMTLSLEVIPYDRQAG